MLCVAIKRSAIAMAYESTGNATLKTRGDAVVEILGNVQVAQGKNSQAGLIYPYDITSFQNLYVTTCSQ